MIRIRIASRFCGPPDSGNGGYSAGLLAAQLSGVVEVTLRCPPPLETDLRVQREPEAVNLLDGERLVAEARPTSLELDIPEPPSHEHATALSRHYVGHRRHHFPTCFVCGPARAVGDGLRIFPGAEQPGQAVAAPWTADASLADASGLVRPEFVWSALDCVGYFATGSPDYPMSLLGRMTAQVLDAPRVGEQCVVLGWSEGRDGRKLHAGTAVFGADRRLLGRALQTWIRLQSSFPPPPASWRSPPSLR
jgi:hypothetical protein